MDDLALLIETPSQEKTALLKSLLEAHGIHAVIQRADTAAFTKFTGAFGGSQFFVMKPKLQEAKKVLGEYNLG